MVEHMRDNNFRSRKESILIKYDANGDGVYDNDEVNAIVDDYMNTMSNNSMLADTNEGQKKIMYFAAVMILLLSISNLGTAFLAMTLAKEVKVSSDGIMTSTDGNDTTLMTMDKVDTISVPGNVVTNEGEIEYFGCFFAEEVEQLYMNAQEGPGTSLIVEDQRIQGIQRSHFIGGSALRTFSIMGEDPIRRSLHLGLEKKEDFQFEYTFPESKVKFVYAPKLCSGANNRRDRKLQEGGPNYAGIAGR